MIYLGADHGGYELKEKVKVWLEEWGYEFEDMGAHELVVDDDYPDFVRLVAEKVSREDDGSKSWKDRAKGVLLCRSGGGMVVAANRYKNVRAVYVGDEIGAKHAREHNDANVISFAGDWIGESQAKEALKIWLTTEFSGEERHVRRLKKMEGGYGRTRT